MTQIARYAQYKKVVIKSVKSWIRSHLTMTGSVLQGTVNARISKFETKFEIESDADPEQVQNILKLARQGCWARQTILMSATFDDTVILNGQPIVLDTQDEISQDVP